MQLQLFATRSCIRPDMFGNCRLIVPWWIFLYAAILFMTVPLNVMLSFCASALVHELFHLLAICIFKSQVYEIRIGVCGARICTQTMAPIQELICTMAGPLGGLLLLLLIRQFPLIALFGFVQSMYNLIPIYPSDGGRVLRCLLDMVLPSFLAERICSYVEWIFLVGITALGIYASFILNLGIIPVGVSIFLLVRKIPCKLDRQRVQ